MIDEKRGKRGRGKDFESEILEVAMAEGRNRMLLRKLDPPTRTIVKGGRPITIQLDGDFLDFLGSVIVLDRDSVFRYPVMIEAKATKKPRLELGDRGLKKAQSDAIFLWHSAGYVTGVLVKLEGDPPRYFFASCSLVTAFVAAGAKSIPLDRMDELQRHREARGPDFFPRLVRSAADWG